MNIAGRCDTRAYESCQRRVPLLVSAFERACGLTDARGKFIPCMSSWKHKLDRNPSQPGLTLIYASALSRASRARSSHLHASSCSPSPESVSYTHLRAHETPEHLVCRLL